MGASGTGKSTLMNLLRMLERPEDGEYLFHDRKIHRLSKRKLTRQRSEEMLFQND